MTLLEFSKIVNISYTTLLRRYKDGRRGDELLDSRDTVHLVDYKGELIPLKELVKYTDVTYRTLIRRYNAGKRAEELWCNSKARNKKSVRGKPKIYVMYEGKEISLTELSKITGIKYITLITRFKKGNDLLQEGKRGGHRGSDLKVKYNGKELTLSQLSKITGISLSTLHRRYHKGIRDERLWTKNRYIK